MKKKLILFILFLVFIYSLGGIIFINYKNKLEPMPIVTEIDEIEKYPYKLKSNSSEYYKEEFELLKINLNGDINDDDYLISVCKLYIIDLYSLDNKLSKYDISTDFIYPEVIENYKLNLQNTLYKYLEDNTNKTRTQKLPVVINVSIDEIKDSKYSLNDMNYSSKEVKVSWTYEEDLGYETNGIITLIKMDDYYYIVEYK